MAYDTIHETVISDIISLLKDAKEIKDTFGPDNIEHSGSLTKATKGLIMEFPVLVSKANHIESAGIIAKAYEAKFVTLLQMAFSSINTSNSEDAIDYLKKFHTNLDSNFTLDEFIDVMDSIVKTESSNISADNYKKYLAVKEDMRNLCYYFEDDINESSLDSFKVLDNYGRLKVVKEAKAKKVDGSGPNFSGVSFEGQAKRQAQQAKNREREEHRNNRAKNTPKLDLGKRSNKSFSKEDLQTAQNSGEFYRDRLPTNLLSTDVRKANELTPTMMIVNFAYVEKDKGIPPIYKSVIIGVKAKLYEVEPTDVVSKIITKNVDSNILLKLIKVGTREISFVKDFLLAIDSAKLDALSKSKRGSTNKLFKVLERRALHGKIRKKLKMKDYMKAISSLVISQEECEELLKNNIDVMDPKVIRPIMEQLNLISFAIIDESSESVKFIWDTGDDIYETIPLSKLEREEKDGMSRKVINLLAKVNR